MKRLTFWLSNSRNFISFSSPKLGFDYPIVSTFRSMEVLFCNFVGKINRIFLSKNVLLVFFGCWVVFEASSSEKTLLYLQNDYWIPGLVVAEFFGPLDVKKIFFEKKNKTKQTTSLKSETSKL